MSKTYRIVKMEHERYDTPRNIMCVNQTDDFYDVYEIYMKCNCKQIPHPKYVKILNGCGKECKTACSKCGAVEDGIKNPIFSTTVPTEQSK